MSSSAVALRSTVLTPSPPARSRRGPGGQGSVGSGLGGTGCAGGRTVCAQAVESGRMASWWQANNSDAPPDRVTHDGVKSEV